MTPMHIAVATENMEVIKLLDDNGADATVENIEGVSPIGMTLANNMKEIKLYFMAQ